ncbi:YrhB domain-containing protein [Ottowia testudinis]|uniref:Immunity protein 35 domain-containing protein n=1 Tax=Ottowia testudinis TaxID=2816950 RepID=A0A975CL66_9BURK|nr:YrhB domain-containing protein [Ottowia testudinis]QTD45508.1 hypothetical protein J1M35_00840 [Ottowia testudinis]
MRLIEISTAKQIAVNFIGSTSQSCDFNFVIIDEHTIERSGCFIFFYESSKFLKTGKFEDRLVGNSPVLIDRKNGDAKYLGTAMPVESYIYEYERS